VTIRNLVNYTGNPAKESIQAKNYSPLLLIWIFPPAMLTRWNKKRLDVDFQTKNVAAIGYLATK